MSIQSRVSTPILPLTSVRFLAAMYVVLLHSAAWSHHLDRSTWIGRFLGSGYTAVGFFFVLSGYILSYVYLNTDWPLDRRRFWTSRFARVYPLLVASLLLDLPHDFAIRLSLHSTGSAILRSLVELLAECALLQSWDGLFRGINAPSWSLSAEAFFYLLFPFVAFRIWRHKGLPAIGIFFLCWCSALLAPVLVSLRYPSLFVEVDSSRLQWAVELMPIFRLFEFMAGIALCSIQFSLVARLSRGQLAKLAYVFIFASCVLFVSFIQYANHVPLLVMSNGLLLPAYGLLILGLSNIQGLLARLLASSWLVLLGEASYAVYLLHAPLWLYFSHLHAIDSLMLWSAYISIVLAVSISSFLFLERPARRKILKLASIRPAITLKQEKVANR